MIKITSVNKAFFKKHKKLTLITRVVLTSTLTATALFISLDDRLPLIKYDAAPPEYHDKYVYDNYVDDRAGTLRFTYQPSQTYKLRVLKGLEKCTHYRIELYHDGWDEYERRDQTIECTEWREIPENNLIEADRRDFSEKQYDKNNEFRIRYAAYDKNSGKFVYNEEEYDSFIGGYDRIIVISDCSLEMIEETNKVMNFFTEEVQKLIDENDSEFDKVKKAYDYVMKHIEYKTIFEYADDKEKDGVFENKYGVYKTDCTGYSEILNTVLNNIGIESMLTVDSTHLHMWNIVKVDGKYYHLDATFSDTGNFKKTSKYRFFLVSDDFMRYEENRYFISEKDVKCEEMYDLTGLVSEFSTGTRGLK